MVGMGGVRGVQWWCLFFRDIYIDEVMVIFEIKLSGDFGVFGCGDFLKSLCSPRPADSKSALRFSLPSKLLLPYSHRLCRLNEVIMLIKRAPSVNVIYWTWKNKCFACKSGLFFNHHQSTCTATFSLFWLVYFR